MGPKFLITDTHFGVKNNSVTWLKKQMEFFYEQFIPHLKKTPNAEVIHLGDVFDSRSSISPFIAQQVVQLFKDIANVCNQVTIIGGNHDYYSPSSDSVDSLSLLLGHIEGVVLIVRDPVIRGGDCFLPWYTYETLAQHAQNNARRFFVHADIIGEIPQVKNVDIYSGHVHIPAKGKIPGGNLYNLGSVFALNFADCNASRGYYVLDDSKPEDCRLQYFENKHSIRFWRLYNDEILQDPPYESTDYIELYIDGPKMIESRFVKAIEKFNERYKNLWVFPTSEAANIDTEDFKFDNLEAAIEECLPDKLKKKFQKLKKV